MKLKYILLSILTPFVFAQGFAQKADGYDISFAIKGMTADTAFLCYHLDGKTYVADTALVNNEKVRFQSDEPVENGMYFLYTKSGIYYEFLLKDKVFKVTADKNNIMETVKVSGSKEVALFIDLQRHMASVQSESKKLQESLKNNPGDSLEVIEKLKALDQQNQEKNQQYINDHKGTFFAQIVTLMTRPSNIEVSSDLSESEQRMQRYLAYKKKYWEGVDFTEPGIIRTPLYLPRLQEYFEKVIPTHPDSLSVALDDFLAMEMDSGVFQYSLVTLINMYANSKIMGMDAVYVHLVDNYYAKGKAPWTDDTTLNRMMQTSNRLRTILIGKQAPDFSIPDLAGKLVSPYTLKDDYVILFIYDSGCGHCKKAAPKMVTAFNNLKEKLSVDLLTVNLSDNDQEWREFVEKYGLNGTNLADLSGTSNVGYYYYVTSTPQIYLLDKDRKIIAKKLGAEQIEDFLINYDKSINQ